MEERALISSIQTEFPVKRAMRMRLSRLIACYNAPPPILSLETLSRNRDSLCGNWSATYLEQGEDMMFIMFIVKN